MDLLKETEQHVKGLFKIHKNELLLFHNLGYVKKTVSFVDQICEKEKVNPIERENTLIAAWFFSTGFLFDYIDYKKQTLKVSNEFLSRNAAPDRIVSIMEIIDVVLNNKAPVNRSCEIILDASEFYQAADDFLLWVKYHRQERNYFLTPKLTKRSFWQTAKNFMNEHKYFTKSGIELFAEKKEANLTKIKFLLTSDLKKQLPVDNRMLINDLKEEIRWINQKVEKRLSSARGFDTLYRITARNQVSLSGMADNKSNILISLNTLIVSAVITFIFLNHTELGYLSIPSFITIGFSVLSIIFAILATRPQIRPGVFKKEDFYAKKVNLLFYGNFYKMDYDDYDKAMQDMLKDQDLLLSNLNRDQYTFGKILGRKFLLINISFTIFMVGFVVSALSYAIVLFFIN